MSDKRSLLVAIGLLGAAVFSGPALAQGDEVGETSEPGNSTLQISIQNLTSGITFRPFLVVASDADTHLFQVGEPANTALQIMAECGAIDPLIAEATARGDAMLADPVGGQLGLLFPGETTGGTISVAPGQSHLSAVAMLLPTNDAFAGLDALPIPTTAGTHSVFLSAYDAATEVNNELEADDNPLDCVPNEPGYPVDPRGRTGTGGTGFTLADPVDTVHVHRGHLGDVDATGGPSNVDSRIHRWLNPVVRIDITVQ